MLCICGSDHLDLDLLTVDIPSGRGLVLEVGELDTAHTDPPARTALPEGRRGDTAMSESVPRDGEQEVELKEEEGDHGGQI